MRLMLACAVCSGHQIVPVTTKVVTGKIPLLKYSARCSCNAHSRNRMLI